MEGDEDEEVEGSAAVLEKERSRSSNDFVAIVIKHNSLLCLVILIVDISNT